jgi:hypothetical protein
MEPPSDLSILVLLLWIPENHTAVVSDLRPTSVSLQVLRITCRRLQLLLAYVHLGSSCCSSWFLRGCCCGTYWRSSLLNARLLVGLTVCALLCGWVPMQRCRQHVLGVVWLNSTAFRWIFNPQCSCNSEPKRVMHEFVSWLHCCVRWGCSRFEASSLCLAWLEKKWQTLLSGGSISVCHSASCLPMFPHPAASANADH